MNKELMKHYIKKYHNNDVNRFVKWFYKLPIPSQITLGLKLNVRGYRHIFKDMDGER